MRICKYWTKKTGTMSDGQEICCKGVSDKSMADAESAASQKIELFSRVHKERKFSDEIKDRILTLSGVLFKADSYELPICEDIIEVLDEKNVITRNRYGALVLNSEDHIFIDIDSPALSFWEKLFMSALPPEKAKERIVKTVHGVAEKKYPDLSFTIYETAKGIRLLVSSRSYKAGAAETKKLFRDFNADRLYERLCRQQNCFRARLTPKPNRIKMHSCTKFNCPSQSDEDRKKTDTWVAEYDSLSGNFATCRLIGKVGSPAKSAVIDYHDRITKISTPLPLA